MSSLNWIRNLYKLSMEDLAKHEKMKVSKQLISQWENGKRPISKQKLKILSEIFGIKEEYFTRELTDDDKQQIEFTRYQQEIEEIEKRICESANGYEYEDTVIDKDTGQEIRIINTGVQQDYDLVEYKEYKLFQVKQLKMINRLKKTLEPKVDEQFGYLHLPDDQLQNYELLVSIIESEKVNLTILLKILKGIALHYNVINQFDVDPIVKNIKKLLEKEKK